MSAELATNNSDAIVKPPMNSNLVATDNPVDDDSMRNNKKVFIDRSLQALLTITLIPWLVGATLMLLLLPAITMFWAERFSDVETSAVSREELLQAADAGLRYVSGGEDRMPRGDDERVAFTAEVISHMHDVRQVFSLFRILTIVLTALLLFTSVMLVQRKQVYRCGQALIIATLSTMALALVLTLFGWLSFDILFTLMHKMLFADGTWQFSYNSLLITAYPFPFWMAMAATWAGILLSACLIGLLAGIYICRRFKREVLIQP